MTTPRVLAGVRILDLTELLPGPYATQILADMGAEIIKIERPGTGDGYRTMRGSTFATINRGKKSVALDLKTAGGREVLLRLAKTADVLVEGYRPGVIKRLGIDYDTLAAANPGIIVASVSGFGQTGPLRGFPGHDLNYNAVAGVLAMCGRSDHPEHAIGVPVADLSGSLYTVISILAAMMLRKATGKGQYLDVSLTDTVLSMVGPRLGHSKQEILCRAGNNVYETKDGHHIAVAALEDHFWARFARVLAIPQLAESRYARSRERWKATDILDPLIQSKMLERTHEEWIRVLTENDVPATPISDLDTLFDHPQLKARGMFLQTGEMRYVNYPVPMKGVDATNNAGFCELGADTDSVLLAAGYTTQQIAALKEKGACG